MQRTTALQLIEIAARCVLDHPGNLVLDAIFATAEVVKFYYELSK